MIFKLLRICTDDIGWIADFEDKTLSLTKKPSRTLIDVWAEPSRFRNYADVMVAPELLPVFLSVLKGQGIRDFQVLNNDLQRNIDKQNAELQRATLLRARRDTDGLDPLQSFNLSVYHRYQQIVDHLRNLSWQYPELARVQNITKTFEGRDLVGIKIGRARSLKPAIFIDAGIHAREWIAPAVAVYVANQLITKYGRQENITKMVDKFDWYIVPVANPDGYEYSMTADRYWRKTRSRNEKISKWCYGVDANRNWGYRWGEVGVSKNPCSGIYAGPEAFSEVEIVGVRDFINEKIQRLQAYISLHSYGQVILAPWGFTTQKPENYEDQVGSSVLIKTH
uniref:Peptidase_M14 domain-containing protein n=1 Tax=Syphacia muris TaxID=451379 RepID=A0A0N5AUE8_9BILA